MTKRFGPFPLFFDNKIHKNLTLVFKLIFSFKDCSTRRLAGVIIIIYFDIPALLVRILQNHFISFDLHLLSQCDLCRTRMTGSFYPFTKIFFRLYSYDAKFSKVRNANFTLSFIFSPRLEVKEKLIMQTSEILFLPRSIVRRFVRVAEVFQRKS